MQNNTTKSNRTDAIQAHNPTVLSLGQIWVDIMMDLPNMPQSGDFAVTDRVTPSVGGSYRVLLAAHRMGAATQHAGIIGNGIWGTAVRNTLDASSIEHIGQNRIDADTGFRLVLNDGEHKTFIATYGAETQGDRTSFDCVEPRPGDIVHISGNTLMDHSAAGIDTFLERVIGETSSRPYLVVLNPTNSLHLVSDRLLENTVLAKPIWSCNRQEARTLAERLGVADSNADNLTVGGSFDRSMADLCEILGKALRAPLILRGGARGAWVSEPGTNVIHVDGFPTKPEHTRSAGSCHTGAVCSMLAQGHDVIESTRIANAAASLSIQHNIAGIPDCPSREEALSLVESRMNGNT